jgi:hypothetical protein
MNTTISGVTGPLTAQGGGRAGAQDVLSQPVPAGELRTGQTERACREHASEV